jgi:hypothetical protein
LSVKEDVYTNDQKRDRKASQAQRCFLAPLDQID